MRDYQHIALLSKITAAMQEKFQPPMTTIPWAACAEAAYTIIESHLTRLLNIRKPEIGDGPVEDAHRLAMISIARGLDEAFNGDLRGEDREVGFVLLVFPFGEQEEGARCNYISNGAARDDIVKLFKEQIIHFESQKTEGN